MTTTTHLSLTLVETAQAQKEVTVNEAFFRLDAILNTGAIDKDLATPPATPANGDVYIVANSPTGAWAGHAAHIAYYDQIWKFIVPNEGVTLWVQDEDSLYVYFGGSAWGRIARSGGKQTLYIPASAMQAGASAGCSALTTIATAANQPDITTRDFDPTTEEYAQFSVRMPKAWNEGSVTAVFEWSHAATTTNFGVVWGIAAASASDADPIGIAFGTAQEVTDTGGTTHALYKSPETASITASGSPAEGDTLYFRLYRKAADVADMLAVDARLHGVALFYTTNSINDD
jgi:hypothetical protein